MKAGISKPTRNRNQFFRFVLSTPQVENWKGAESLIDLRAQGIFSVTGNKTSSERVHYKGYKTISKKRCEYIDCMRMREIVFLAGHLEYTRCGLNQ